jgi:hypothetical protein
VAQSSCFWTTGVGDGLIGYTEDDFANWLKYSFTTDRQSTEGVIPGIGTALAVTGTSSPVAVAAGSAYVAGFFYNNSASLNVAIPTPSAGTTAHRVVLRADITGNTVRTVLLSATDGSTSIPGVTQTAGAIWEISLATLTITTGGTISVTDARDYTHAGASVMRRSGGSSTTWATSGSTTYTPGGTLIQAGVASVEFDDDNDSETKTVTFPTAFSGKPLIWVTNISASVAAARDSNINVYEQGTSSFKLRGRRMNGDWNGTMSVEWLAIGPR